MSTAIVKSSVRDEVVYKLRLVVRYFNSALTSLSLKRTKEDIFFTSGLDAMHGFRIHIVSRPPVSNLLSDAEREEARQILYELRRFEKKRETEQNALLHRGLTFVQQLELRVNKKG